MFQPEKTNKLQIILLALSAIAFILLILAVINIASPKDKDIITNNWQSPISQNFNIVSKNMVSFLADNPIVEPQIRATDPIIGQSEAPITIYEYSSLACPSSARMNPLMAEILSLYPDKVRLIWKDLPLEDVYPGATKAHLALRCAQQQDKFSQYQELLFANQENFSQENILALADKAGLNLDDFNTCLTDPQTAQLIADNIAEAENLDIPGTPHFYINSQELLGVSQLEDFERIIDAELSQEL